MRILVQSKRQVDAIIDRMVDLHRERKSAFDMRFHREGRHGSAGKLNEKAGGLISRQLTYPDAAPQCICRLGQPESRGNELLISETLSRRAAGFIEYPFQGHGSIDNNAHRSSLACRTSSSEGTLIRPRVRSRQAAARSQNPARPPHRVVSRIKRCSASALLPCSLARRFRASTTSCDTLRTSSWAISASLISCDIKTSPCWQHSCRSGVDTAKALKV
jgi:hypothetical protein